MEINRLLKRHGLLPGLALLLFTILAITPVKAHAQATNGSTELLSVFLDCNFGCFEDYLRSEITFVNFVRDQNDAQIHLQINSTQTGSGGRQYTLTFLGRQEFSSHNDTLTYSSAQSDTQNETRGVLARYVRLGLSGYIAQTPLFEYADFTVEGLGNDQEGGLLTQQQEDPWNNWIFEIGVNGSMNGEANESAYEFNGEFNASRVTDDWKIELETQYDYEEENFELRDGREVNSTTTNQSFDGLVVRSINDHWSIGITSRVGSSTFRNLDFELRGSPAIEYNIFPYREYNEHELYFRYEISPTYYEYSETTIYGKNEEFLVQHQLRAALEVTRTWGRVNASLTGSQYLHDTSKNRLELNGFMDFRIFRGLSLRLNGNYSLINDQLTLRAQDISDAEALLRQRQQATSYDFRVSVGISYTFGSIFNNVVNPRFSGAGGGGGGGGRGGPF